MRTLINKVVNIKDITHFWLMVVGMAYRMFKYVCL